MFSNHTVIKHNLTTNRPPNANELQVGEIAVWIQEKQARLYTKTATNEILEINKPISFLSELLDVDLTNLKEGSFLVKKGDKFVASNILGSVADLTDIELREPLLNRQYLRYDDLFKAFVNVYPSYNLYELLDVEVLNPTTASNAQSLDQNDKTLYYDHTTRSFKTRLRRNRLTQLDDVEIPIEEYPSNKVLVENAEGIWTPRDLEIVFDTSPQLGGNLNFNGHYSLNQTYRVNRLTISNFTHDIDYRLGDYWIIQGVPASVVPSSILNFIRTPELNQAMLIMLEIRQSSGQILLGGLENVEYEDGRPILLSGQGKTDLITVLITNSQSEGVKTVITAAALNLAKENEGGEPAERYPGLGGGSGPGGGSGSQSFLPPSLYDDYYDSVVLLLNFESEVATGKTWTQDKSQLSHPTTITASQVLLTQSPFGLAEFAASFSSTSNSILVEPTAPIILNADFTLEFFINYSDNNFYKGTAIEHTYFQSTGLAVKYVGTVSPIGNGFTETSQLKVTIGSQIITFSNAVRLFHNQNNRYVHFALVRTGVNVYLYVDGYRFNPDNVYIDNPVTSLTLGNITISLQGNLNSVRLTKNIARYSNHFNIPNMRFGLTGGAEDLMEDYIFNTSHYLGEKELEHEIFDFRT